MKIILPTELEKGATYYYPDLKNRGVYKGSGQFLYFENIKDSKEARFPLNTLFYQKEYPFKGVILVVLIAPVLMFLCADIDLLTPKQFWLFFSAFLAYIILFTIIVKNSNLLK